MAVIDRRRSPTGELTYRVRIRRRGQPLQSATFRRLAEAREWARQQEALADARHHFPARPAPHALAEVIDRYTREVLPTLRRQAQQNQRTHLAYWRTTCGDTLLHTLTPQRITTVRDQLTASPATRNRYVATLSALCVVAWRSWGWLQHNPAAGVRKAAEPRGRVRFLSAEERTALVEACQASAAPYLYPLVILALTTGARRGELLGLQWSDIDWPRHRLTFHDTKNGERRTVPLVGIAQAVLTQWRAQQDATAVRVFPVGEVRKAWETAVRRAGLTAFVFHDLRHSAASYLAMSGASLLEIAAILGHKTLQMTKRYSHLTENHLAGVSERMSQEFVEKGYPSSPNGG